MDKKNFYNSLNYQIEDLDRLVDIQLEKSFDLEMLIKLLPEETAKLVVVICEYNIGNTIGIR